MGEVLSGRKWAERNEGGSDFLNTTKKITWVLAATIIATSSTNADELKIWEKITFPVKEEYKVSKISEVKKICENVAEDIDGWKYVVKLPTSLYERYKNDIMYKFPDNEWCTFIVATRETKTSPNTEVVYTSAFWDTDASDIVAQETAEAEKAKTEAEKAKKELKESRKLLTEKWYLWYLMDNILALLNNKTKAEKAIITLKKINTELKLWNLKGNKYADVIKDGLETIKLKYWNNEEINKLVDSILKKLHLD